MRKWTYLVAMLMLAGATTTFTGCIDTDEPAGIEELRGAKASLLKAKEAVEAAIAAEKQANAALTLAEAKKAEAEAAYTQAQVKIKEEEAKQAALETELKAAKNEAEKARIEAEIAEAAKRKADAENQMKQAAAQFEADLKKLEALLLQNEALFVEAQKNLATAKATLTDDQVKAIETAESAVAAAKTALDSAEDKYIKANEGLYEAMLGKKYSNDEARLNYNIMLYQNKLDAAKQVEALAKANSEKDVEATDWEKELEANKEYIRNQQLFIDSLGVEIEKIHVENKAAWDSVMLAKNEFFDRTNNNAPEYKYYFSEYVNNTLDTFPAVKKALETEFNVSNLSYSYGKSEILLATYYNDNYFGVGYEDLGLIEGKQLVDSIKGRNPMYLFLEGFDAKIEDLKDAKKSLNELIKDTLDKEHEADWDKNIAKADSTFKADSLEWTILVKALKGEKTEPTALVNDFKKAITAYNTKYAEVAPAVANNNAKIDALKKAIDEVGTSKYNAVLDSLKADMEEKIYTGEATEPSLMTKINNILLANIPDWKNGSITVKKTQANLDKLLDVYVEKADSIKNLLALTTDTVYADWAKTGEAAFKATATSKKEAGITADINAKSSKILTAYKAYKTASDSIKVGLPEALESDSTKFETAYATFKSKLNSEYGQVVDKAYSAGQLKIQSTAADTISAKAHFDLESFIATAIATKLNVNSIPTQLDSLAVVAKCTDISADETTKLTATKLDEYENIETVWNTKSREAWGVDDRMIPLTEEEIAAIDLTSWNDDNIETAPGIVQLLYHQNAKADMNEELGANAVIDRLIAELEAQKAVAVGELNAAIEAAEAVYADYVARIDDYATLDDEIQAEKEAAQDLYDNYMRINGELETVIKTYYATVIEGNTNVYNYYSYTNVDGQTKTVKSAADLKDYFFDAYLQAQKKVVYAEADVLEAKANLERYQEGLYDAVADNNILVERAKADYEVALKVYQAALNNLNALLASFAAE